MQMNLSIYSENKSCMILVLGGTTEGRIVARILEEAGKPFLYSTKGGGQEMELVHGKRICGAMDEKAMAECCSNEHIGLIIDAAHPFAVQLHQTVAGVAAQLGLPVIRYERKYPPRNPDFIWCDDYVDAMQKMRQHKVSRLLAWTGVNTIRPLKAFWSEHESFFRILDREDSRRIAMEQGFPTDHLLFYQEESDEDMIRQIAPDAILTKESGTSGFFEEKTHAAVKYGIPVYVIKRPQLSPFFLSVDGEFGLRREIYRLLPGFFDLHCGLTTGSCATAAAKAALYGILYKIELSDMEIQLPSGESVTLPIASVEEDSSGVTCSVIKESGDDPDVTNGCVIRVHVQVIEGDGDNEPEVCLKAGPGVGTVTLPGLGLEVGGPAINQTPRRMIESELRRLVASSGRKISSMIVTVSVDHGEELAKRTFNPKLGIVGGISIIGTSGIVRPFSSEAFVASIRKEIQVAKAIGSPQLVINSGAKSERFLKSYLASLNLPLQAYVHYGNFIGDTVRIAVETGFRKIIMGLMLGKAVKLAEGALDTHSKKVIMNRDYLLHTAEKAHCGTDILSAIRSLTLARELWQIISPEAFPDFYQLILQDCYQSCKPLLQSANLDLLLISEEGKVIPLRTV